MTEKSMHRGKRKKIMIHFQTYIFRGILATIPIALSFFAIVFIYQFIDKRVVAIIYKFFGFQLPGLGLLLSIMLLYLLGIIASNVVGKKFFLILETVLDKIPIVKTTYQVGKQLSETLSLPEKQVFKKAVLVDYFKPNVWVIGFITGTIKRRETNETLIKVFIPTVPNPTSGFLAILKEKDFIDPQWSVEEAMKMVISGGIIGPDEIRKIKAEEGAS